MNDPILPDDDSGLHQASHQERETATLTPNTMMRTNLATFVGVMALIGGVVTGYCDLKNTLSKHADSIANIQSTQAVTLSTLGEVRDALLIHNLLGPDPVTQAGDRTTTKGQVK